MAAGGHLSKGVEQVHLAPPQSGLSTKVNKHEWFPQGTPSQKIRKRIHSTRFGQLRAKN